MDLLPPELMELQLAQIDLLLSMYPEDNSIKIETTTLEAIDVLKRWAATGLTREAALACGPMLSLLLRRELQGGEYVEMNIFFPVQFGRTGPTCPSEPPHPRVKVQQPSFMTKAEISKLNADIEELNLHGGPVDLISAIMMIEDVATNHLNASIEKPQDSSTSLKPEGPLTRVWFYFPSISTREKRDDLINHAPSYGLTGFLLAGKPGFLCVEGSSKSIDDYMKFIKTESWGDIPAHHKKVSERYRESGAGVKREFEDMREVTDEVGERRGERANRTDMKALEIWLGERGFGDVMRKIVI